MKDMLAWITATDDFPVPLKAEGVEPACDTKIRLRLDELGDNVGIDEKSLH